MGLNKSARGRLFFIGILPAILFGTFAIVSISLAPVVIISNSMAPTLNVGDLVFLERGVSPCDYKTGVDGDIVVISNKTAFMNHGVPASAFPFLDEATPIIHRAIDSIFINGSRYFATKGDNNPFADGCVRLLPGSTDDHGMIEYNTSNPVYIHESHILGRVVFSVPFIGYFKIHAPTIALHAIMLATIIIAMLIRKVRIVNEEKNLVRAAKSE